MEDEEFESDINAMAASCQAGLTVLL